MFTTMTEDFAADEVMKHLLEKVHEFDNQPLYNLEFKLFLLLNDRMAISELLKTRPIEPDFYSDAKKLFKSTINFYDENIYLFCKDFVAEYEKRKKQG